MIDNTKNTQISVFDIKIKRIFVANNVLLNNTIMKKLLLLAFVLCSSLLCRAQEERVILGDEQTSEYFPILKDKRIAIFSNHTGMIGDKHLLDILLENKFNVVAIFSPEHGFRGDADAGEHVSSSVDKKTGVPILSLYDGKSGKPSEASMRKFDILVVDIQDVGLRFYTYYASMCRLMDACAEYNRKVLILDRPNPNGHYVDGPILDMKYKSGVGWLPIPVVHGMTLGELGLMVNGERWLPASRTCDLTVIPCKNYTHQTLYKLPIPPSPQSAEHEVHLSVPLDLLFRGHSGQSGKRNRPPLPGLRASQHDGLQLQLHPAQCSRSQESAPAGQALPRREPEQHERRGNLETRY